MLKISFYSLKKYQFLGLFLFILLLVYSFFPWDLMSFSSSEPLNEDLNVVSNQIVDKIEITEDLSIKTNFYEDGIASFLSGVDTSSFCCSVDSDFWNIFTKNINNGFSFKSKDGKISKKPGWNKIKKERLDPIINWSQSNFIKSDIDTSLLFYPFSGPDFLHAFHFYPNANEYILLALEEVGSMPDFSSISKDSIQTYATNLNLFLRDIYLRSYFITGNMIDDISENKVDGVLSTLYWFIKKTNHEIIKVEKVTLDSLGNIIEEKNISEGWNINGFDGVRFHFKNTNNKLKKLVYFSCDISDQAFTGKNGRDIKYKNSNLLAFLNNMRDCNTFIKSASYMMHHDRDDLSFKNVRDIILEKSKSIFQDDTGVPFKYINENNWNITVYGTYEKPIKDFDRWTFMMQEDLDLYFKNKENYGGLLPFSLGYHWQDKKQNQMLFLRK